MRHVQATPLVGCELQVDRDEGLVEMRRRRGATVRDTADTRARLVQLARELVAEATKQGLTPDQLHDLLEDLR